MSFTDPGIFTGGQMTDLPSYSGAAFDGTELFEIVAPGNPANGINYGITSQQMALLFNAFVYVNTILTTGATLAVPYVVPTTVTRLLINKSVPSVTYISLQAASLYPGVPILIRDLAGNAQSGPYPIHVTFSGAETCDGLSEVVIGTDFGGYVFNPLSSGNWFLTGA